MPERRLEHFLISTKLSLERAKQRLDLYYTVRRLVPELLAERDPRGPDVAQFRQIFQWTCLPKLTPDKYRVTILKCIDGDASKFHPWTLFKYTFMIADVRISECRCLGDIYIYDLAGIKIGHVTKLTPGTIKKALVLVTKAYGSRIKGIHFINSPSFVDRLVTLLKSVMKPKLASRVHVHSVNSTSLYDVVPKSILPVDYGGDQPAMEQLSKSWDDKLYEWSDWFLAQEKCIVNEKLRCGTTVDVDELFGFSGSFRNLEVD
ncbi:alpha-tocopherol transfer protein-like isoform X2 [Venturia canescens]|nr:alpha-tocopherol transfer protein-like isoform X2 [Venturia canescens]